jgi:hypothetical protein
MMSQASFAIFAALCASALAAESAAAQTQFSGSGRQTTLDCQGGTVVITGGRNDLRIRGPCRKVSVTGAANVVAVDSAAAIEISGAMNRVTWREGVDGRPPRVSRTGVGNTVAQASAPRPGLAQSAARQGADAAASGGEAVEILSDGVRRTIDCGGRSLALMGSRNTLTLRGRCPLVKVSGDDNLLTVEAPEAILVTGDRNQVGWSDGPSPKVSSTGRQNRIGPTHP